LLRVTSFTLFLLVSMISWADDIKCNTAGSQNELNACAYDELAKADKELNAAYQALIKNEAENPIFISKLKLAQKAWIAFRDAELEAFFACPEKNPTFCWGSMYPMSFSLREAELTRETSYEGL
jgi:uncharacterized protein YecT (DUF1311 family)